VAVPPLEQARIPDDRARSKAVPEIIDINLLRSIGFLLNILYYKRYFRYMGRAVYLVCSNCSALALCGLSRNSSYNRLI
jgi:hypothetical protein